MMPTPTLDDLAAKLAALGWKADDDRFYSRFSIAVHEDGDDNPSAVQHELEIDRLGNLTIYTTTANERLWPAIDLIRHWQSGARPEPEPVGAERVREDRLVVMRRFGMASSNAQKAFMEDQAGGSHRAYLVAVQEEEAAESALLALLAEPEPVSNGEVEAGAKALWDLVLPDESWNPEEREQAMQSARSVLTAARTAREGSEPK
jgi:hypothetical protein